VKGDKQSNRLAEILGYIGNRREMEDSKSIPSTCPVFDAMPLLSRGIEEYHH
jgi:hypothetical protein